jgi:hypothetical protein
MPSLIPRAPSWQFSKTSKLLRQGYFRAGFVFLFYASSHVHYFLGQSLRSLHAWLRACGGAFATKNIELLFHARLSMGFKSSSHTIVIRVASERTTKMRNHYQLAIQRDLFPNKFHQRLPWMSFLESCHVLMLSMSDITILSISIYASSAFRNSGGLPFGSRRSGLRVILIPELWGSNHDQTIHSDPAAVAFAPFWFLNCGDQTMRFTRSWYQKCIARHFVPQCWGSKPSHPAAVAFALFWSMNARDQSIRPTRSWGQKWRARHFHPSMLGIKTFWSCSSGLRVIFVAELWESKT